MESWFCTKCGSLNTSRFCTACGTPMPVDAPVLPVQDESAAEGFVPVEAEQSSENTGGAAPEYMQEQPEQQYYAAEQPSEQQYYAPAQEVYAPAAAYAPENKKKRLSGGAIAGIVVGVIVIAAVAVLLLMMGTPTGIELSAYEAEMKVGDELQLTATVHRFLAKDTVNDVTWESTDPSALKVTGGAVNAVDEGTATVSAFIGDKIAECSVAAYWPTVTLGGSDYKINVKELDLSDCGVNDLSAITELFQLESLDLTDNPVSDISVLAEVSTLKSVTLTGTQVKDLSPIIGSMDITMDGLSTDIQLDFGEVYSAGEEDFGIETGGAGITWDCYDEDLITVNGSSLEATCAQNDISAFNGECTVYGTVNGTNIELVYNIEVGADALSYSTEWSDGLETISTSSYTAKTYTLHVEPAIEEAYGITFDYIVYPGESGDAAKRDFTVRIYTTAGKWKKIGNIPVEYYSWKTATIMFEEPMSFTRLVILPNTVCRWSDDYTITSIFFAPDNTQPL